MSSWSRELCALTFGLALALSGCTKERRCQGPELCKGRDDDCDGQVDEDFLDANGRYDRVEHCGSCGVACSAVFPTALTTRCALDQAEPICELASCAQGFHAVADSECVADQNVLCLPCDGDDECALRTPGARCLITTGGRACGMPCSLAAPCSAPFRCDTAAGQCVPETELCACKDAPGEVELACLVPGLAAGRLCAGLATCGPAGLGECSAAGIETCNGQDDDCDGQIDETFLDAQGRYVGPLHCGSCGTPCVAPGPHYVATCLPDSQSARCNIACEASFFDVDGVLATGCECQRFDGTSAPIASGSDADCDGVVDVESAFLHVSSQGVDSANGSSIAPLRTVAAAIQRARTDGKPVLVAEGSYDGFAIQAGVRVYGGYRVDFRARDPLLYPTVIEAGSASDGAPVITCSGVSASSVLDGFTIRGADASTVGRGATAAVFDRCGSDVSLANVTLIAGRAADGSPGIDGSQRVPALSALTGAAGSAGRAGFGGGCPSIGGGPGGQKSCGASEVSGGGGGAAACVETNCVNGGRCANAGCTDFTQAGTCDYPEVLRLAVSNPAPGRGLGRTPGAPGGVTYNAPTNRAVCSFCDDNPTLPRQGQDGAAGALGSPGDPGPGCADARLSFDSFGRAAAVGGGDGSAGTSGSGGGGGSAGAGFDVIRGTEPQCSDVPGGSGGGGGSGGCGAPFGGGGGGGGASVGVLVLTTAGGAGPTFSNVRIVTGAGGRGGDGGIGAAGGAGGQGAPGGGSQFWCARSGGRGGDGGDGGSGGGGGGGCGGASHGLAVSGTGATGYRALAVQSITIERVGVPGQGGLGGFSPDAPGAPGAQGDSTPTR